MREILSKQLEASFYLSATKNYVSCRFDNLSFALSRISGTGMYLEFGVCEGHTINHIAKQIKETIYGFDSFQGIPEDWFIPESLNDPSKPARFPKGSWKVAEKPKVNRNVVLIDGWFDESFPHFVQTLPDNTRIAFMHVDSDLYSSAKSIFKYFGNYITSGTIIVFDEWHAKGHEDKAFNEWLEESKHTATIIAETNWGQITVCID